MRVGIHGKDKTFAGHALGYESTFCAGIKAGLGGGLMTDSIVILRVFIQSGKLDDQRLVFLQGGNTGLGVVLIGFFSILNKQFSCNRSQQAQGYGVIGGLTQQHISRESLAVQGG